MNLSSAEIASRLVSDLRLGLPVILKNKNVNSIVIAIETLREKKFSEIMKVAKTAINKKRNASRNLSRLTKKINSL